MQPVRGGQPFLALIAAFLPARRPITRQLVMLAPSESTKCASITARSHVFAHLSCSSGDRYAQIWQSGECPSATDLYEARNKIHIPRQSSKPKTLKSAKRMFEEQRIVLESLPELMDKHLGSTSGLEHIRFILVGRRSIDLRTTFADHEITNLDGLDLTQSPTFDAVHRVNRMLLFGESSVAPAKAGRETEAAWSSEGIYDDSFYFLFFVIECLPEIAGVSPEPNFRKNEFEPIPPNRG